MAGEVSYHQAIMDRKEAAEPPRWQRWTAFGGLLAVVLVVPAVFAVFGVAALPWVLVVGGIVASFLAVGIFGRAVIARRFPVTYFDLNDLSDPAGRIEDAKARLAEGDYAAFTVSAVRHPTEPEASGRIWVFAAKSDGIHKTSIELDYEPSTNPVEHQALTRLLGDWEIAGWEPAHWVLLTRPGDVPAVDAVWFVAEALTMLFDVPPSSRWTFRAFA